MSELSDKVIRKLNLNNDLGGLVRRVIDRIAVAIAERGYEQFVDDVTSDNFQGGPHSPIGNDQLINLIPGHGSRSCCSTLVAVSDGDRGNLGFTEIMRRVRAHLIICGERTSSPAATGCSISPTRVVIFVCSTWSQKLIAEHLGDLRAHHSQGVHFIVLLATGAGVSFIDLSLDSDE